MNVLVVDDDKDSRETAAAYLVSLGHIVGLAANGLEGLETLSQWTPDAVILDMVMPVVTGPQFLETIRNHPKWEHLPVVVLSAMDPDKLIDFAHQHPDVTILAKPADPEELAKELAHIAGMVGSGTHAALR